MTDSHLIDRSRQDAPNIITTDDFERFHQRDDAFSRAFWDEGEKSSTVKRKEKYSFGWYSILKILPQKICHQVCRIIEVMRLYSDMFHVHPTGSYLSHSLLQKESAHSERE